MSVTTPVEAAEEVVVRIATRVSTLDGFPAGGALLGPRLMIATAGGLQDVDRLVLVGTAVELLRRATLIHRSPQVEALGPGLYVTPLSGTLRGDMLFAESFRLLSEDGEPRLGTVLSCAMASVSESEVISGEGPDPDRRIRYAAAYYRGAAATGAILGGIAPSLAGVLTDWGQSVGEAHERSLRGEPVSTPADPPALPRDLRDWVLSAVGAPDRV
jgi:geranylgeranyl pyrophosphate synthase